MSLVAKRPSGPDRSRELTETGRTLLADSALACANYYHMIHARRSWFTVEQLRDVVLQHRVADRHDR